MKGLRPSTKQVKRIVWILVLCGLGSSLFLMGIFPWIANHRSISANTPNSLVNQPSDSSNILLWQAPDTTEIPKTAAGDLIRYGRDLIAHTAVYLGPKGKVKQISNGMNCQNCHLDAGTVPFGNNYGSVATKYPTFRERSGTIESFEKRVNDCLERSLNGKRLDEDGKEMKAIVSYLKWVGKDLAKGDSTPGIGLISIQPLDRAADPAQGALVYQKHCAICHGKDGEGVLDPNEIEWTYPPLFGKESYNVGAGLYRVSTLSRYVKANMPFGTTYNNPVLTDEEAWDVAAYVNSMWRPEKDIQSDWPDISKKPYDHPFGPYTDTFSENQHKYGPFKPIIEAHIR